MSAAAAAGMKKRKAGVAGAATPAKPKKKLATSIDSVMARLETTNASFLQQHAASAVQAQLAKVKASDCQHACAAARPAAAPRLRRAATCRAQAPSPVAKGTSPSLSSLPVDQLELARRLERQQRFREEQAAAAAAAGIKQPAKTLVALRSEQGVARGQNQSLEKDYLRLTALPSAADVRPPEVLRQALELVKHRWAGGWEYTDCCNQLKSIRQDLTVQHTRTRLTVQVYETHGRIAIEVGDFAEYRQCHSVLQQLYADGLPGERHEFASYGLLYAAATGRAVLAHELTEAFCRGGGVGGGPEGEPCVAHALAACRAYAGGDFVRFLRLYEGAPRMQPYLLDLLLAKLRHRAYSTVLAAFQPAVTLAALSSWFGFQKKKEAAAFLRERGAVVQGGSLQIKPSRAAAQRLQREQEQQEQQQQQQQQQQQRQPFGGW